MLEVHILPFIALVSIPFHPHLFSPLDIDSHLLPPAKY
jgi:hypothetical protein